MRKNCQFEIPVESTANFYAEKVDRKEGMLYNETVGHVAKVLFI